MSRFLLGALAAALLFAVFILQSSAMADESAELGGRNTITMNFQNVDIPVLAKFISEITEKLKEEKMHRRLIKVSRNCRNKSRSIYTTIHLKTIKNFN